MSWLSYDELVDTFDSIGALASKGSYRSGALTSRPIASSRILSPGSIGNVNPLARASNLVSPVPAGGALANLFGGGSGTISSGGGSPIVSLPPGTVGQLQTPVSLPPPVTPTPASTVQPDLNQAAFDYNYPDSSPSDLNQQDLSGMEIPDSYDDAFYDDEAEASDFIDD